MRGKLQCAIFTVILIVAIIAEVIKKEVKSRQSFFERFMLGLGIAIASISATIMAVSVYSWCALMNKPPEKALIQQRINGLVERHYELPFNR